MRKYKGRCRDEGRRSGSQTQSRTNYLVRVQATLLVRCRVIYETKNKRDRPRSSVDQLRGGKEERIQTSVFSGADLW
jgi:hypothetical protein